MSVLDIDIDYDGVILDNWLLNTFTCEYWGEWGEIELWRGYKENRFIPKGKYHSHIDRDINGRYFEICWYPKGELFKNPKNNTVKRIRQSIAIIYCRLGDYGGSMGGYHYIKIELGDLCRLVHELKNFNFNPNNYKAYK